MMHSPRQSRYTGRTDILPVPLDDRQPAGRQDAGRSIAARRGFNMVELLFAVSAISALSILAMTVIGMLMTAEQHSAEGLWIDVTVANFADDLRSDAHRATALEATPDAENLVRQITLIAPGDIHVTYECTGEGVVRRQTHNGETQANETYRLALGSSTFAPPGDDGLLKWTHTREVPSIGGFSPSDSSASALRTYEITTAVGLHNALTTEDDQ